MPFQTRCPECQTSFTVEDHYLDRWVHCAKCRGTFQVKSLPGRTVGTPEARAGTEDTASREYQASSRILGWLSRNLIGLAGAFILVMMGVGIGIEVFGGLPETEDSEAKAVDESENRTNAIEHARGEELQDLNKRIQLMQWLSENRRPPPQNAEDVPDYLRLLDIAPPEVYPDFLNQIRNERSAELLARFLVRPEFQTRVRKVLIAIGKPAREAVMEYLAHRDRATRFEAWTIMGRIGALENLPTLEAARAREHDRDVLHAATEAIKAIRK